MAIQIKVTLNRQGIGQVAKSPDLRAELLRRAQRVAQRAQASVEPGEREFIEASAYTGRTRARASVMYRGGLRAEIADRVLGRAVDAARD